MKKIKKKEVRFTDPDEFDIREIIDEDEDAGTSRLCLKNDRPPEEIAFRVAGESTWYTMSTPKGREVVERPKKKKTGKKVTARLRIGREKPRGQAVNWANVFDERVASEDGGTSIGKAMKDAMPEIAQAIQQHCTGSDAVWVELHFRHGKKVTKKVGKKSAKKVSRSGK